MQEKFDMYARRRARRALVQATYQWQLAETGADELYSQFVVNGTLERADTDFFDECMRGVVGAGEKLDVIYEPYLDRTVGDLDHIERAILRAGTWELEKRVDVPYKVVIDEYVTLAKTFGAQDSYKYINGVLDRVAKALRVAETE